jgi:hypothetical protein
VSSDVVDDEEDDDECESCDDDVESDDMSASLSFFANRFRIEPLRFNLASFSEFERFLCDIFNKSQARATTFSHFYSFFFSFFFFPIAQNGQKRKLAIVESGQLASSLK